MMLETDLEQFIHLKELRMTKSEQQSNMFWFPTPVYPGKTEDHTSLQRQIPKELHELKENRNSNLEITKNPEQNSLNDSIGGHTRWETSSGSYFGWVSRYFCKKWKWHRIEHGFHCGTNTKGWQNCLQTKITIADPAKKRPIFWYDSDAQKWNSYSVALLYSCNLIIAQRKQTENLRQLVDLMKIKSLTSVSDYTNNNQPVIPCQMQHNIWQVSFSSASSFATKRITICWMRTKGQWKGLHLNLPAELLL